MFSQIAVKKNQSQPNRSFNQVASMFGRLYEEAMAASIRTEHGRGPEYRPSSFPICSVLVYMQFLAAARNGFYESNMGAGGGFFTSVGTAAHENIQRYIGESGKIYGHWKCRNPKCKRSHAARDLYDEKGKIVRPGALTRESTTNNKCPTCKHAMEYVELEINYNGLKGHIDCIVKLEDGSYWVADYKTTTANNLKSTKLPKSEHLMQLPTYCYVLEKKYKMKIRGFSLLYFSRDNPYSFREHADKWTPRWRSQIGALIKDQKRVYRNAVRAFVENKPDLAIKCKVCTKPSDYEEKIDRKSVV